MRCNYLMTHVLQNENDDSEITKKNKTVPLLGPGERPILKFNADLFEKQVENIKNS